MALQLPDGRMVQLNVVAMAALTPDTGAVAKAMAKVRTDEGLEPVFQSVGTYATIDIE